MIHFQGNTKKQNLNLVLHFIHPGLADFLEGCLLSFAPLFSVDAVWAKAVLQILLGGVIVFIHGVLIGRS
jgi:hypothetical protein